jgi:TonB-dependent receptor
MKRNTLLLSLFLSCIFLTAHAQNALLKVKVIDENNLNLPGAIVLFNNQKQKAITDASGTAIIYGIRLGKQSLKVTYIGYQEQVFDIDVKAGLNEYGVRMVSGVSMLQGVVVLGDRLKGQAKALNQQRNLGNITNIVSADQVGRFPDANIGDALKRVPGITMQNDQGEARDIIIRGLAPQLNAVTLNGDRIPSAEGDNRKVQMDLIPSDMVQLVEVNKTLTPDMEADAIGGSVNLITRTAPDKFRFSGTTSLGYNPIRDGALANVSLIGGGRVFNKKVGVILSMNVNDNVYGSDNVEAVWSRAANGAVFMSQHDIRKYDVRRVRRSYNLTTDYRINKKNSITLSAMYNWRDDWENRFRARTRNITPLDAAGVPVTTAGQTIANYRGEIRRETKGGSNYGRIKNARLEEQIVQNVALRGDHLLGSKAKIEWSSAYSKASETRPNERYIDFNATNLILNQDLGEMPNVTQVSRRNMSGFAFRRLSEQFGKTNETDWNNKISVRFPLDIFKDRATVVKVGARYSRKEKSRDASFFIYTPLATGTYSRTNGALQNLAIAPAINQNPQNGWVPGTKFNVDSFVRPDFLGSINVKNWNDFTEASSPADFLGLVYNAEEKLTNAYLRVDQEISEKLSMILGVRFERTETYYRGNVLRNSNTLVKSNEARNSYQNILPGLTFRYQAKKDLILRAAVTSAIARPAYFDLVPFVNVNSNDQLITLGNSDLKATRSLNLDLMAEKYFTSVGIISAGVFYKTLNDFFYTYSTNTYDSVSYQREILPIVGGTNPMRAADRWRYQQQRNGDQVRLFGFEVAFQRQLDFLPGKWKGLGVYLNYTYTKSTADGVYSASGIKRTGISLPGTAPHMFNGSLSYEDKRFIARVSLNYTAAYIDLVGADAFEDSYYDKQLFVDFNTSYALSPRVRWFLEANNLTNQPLRYYQGVASRTMQVEYYRSRWNTGIKFDVF